VPLLGLTNGVSYDVQVSAENIAGYGPWSGTAVGTPLTTATTPQLFQTIPADQSVILHWAPPANLGGSAVINYLVSYRSGTIWTDVQTTQLTTTFTGLDNGVAYDVRVGAITAAGLGALATSSVTPFGVPEIVVITPTPSDSEVALSWTAAAPNGSAVIAYDLQYKLASDSIWTTPPAPTGLSATVTGLTNGTSYDFRVRAYNQGGAGPFAAISATPSTIPGVPQGFTAIGGDQSITIDWDAPLDDGGSPITSYDVEYKDAVGWVDAAGATTITGLTNSLLHDVHVRAVNAVGPGPWATLGVTPYQFEPSFSVPAGTTLKAGDTVTISGDEALPGETVAIELQSAPIHLGSTVVATDGSYTLTVTIPSTAVGGAHHLVAMLGASLGSGQLAVAVLGPSALAGTGIDLAGPIGMLALLLLGGGVLVWRSRRAVRAPR
jgi:titin